VTILAHPDETERRILARFVERLDVWTPRPGEAYRAYDLMPDGGATLVLRVFDDGAFDANVRGPRTQAHYKVAAALPLVMRVVFRPGGAYPFFGVPAFELADATTPLDALWGRRADTLRDEVLEGHGCGRDVSGVVARHLVARLRERPFEPPGAVAARAAVPLIASGASLDAVARAVGLSHRHLRRAFRATVGFGPKTFARIARFHRARALAAVGHLRWGEVARAAGYFDQSHLIADFRALARVSPATLDRPSRHPC
jgi:AraC-like DNA-binding protein